jgi:hypothetical protein
MACKHGWGTPAVLLPGTPYCSTRAQQQRLGNFSLVEALLGAFLNELPHRQSKYFTRFVEGCLDNLEAFGQLSKHPHRLRTLTGKNESETHTLSSTGFEASVDDLFAFVETISRNMMTPVRFTRGRLDRQGRIGQRVMGTTLTSPGAGNFAFLDCHGGLLLISI